MVISYGLIYVSREISYISCTTTFYVLLQVTRLQAGSILPTSLYPNTVTNSSNSRHVRRFFENAIS